MTTFNWTEASGTTPETIDAKWAGGSTEMETNGSGVLQCNTSPNPFNERNLWYDDSQPATQEVTVVIKAGSASSGQYIYPAIQKNGSQNGYEFSLNRSVGTNMEILRNGTSVAGPTPHGIDPTTTDYTLKLVWTGTAVEAYLNGGGSPVLSYTDGTPLTGGFPGMRVYCAGTTTLIQVDSFSDGAGGGPPPPSGDLVVPSAPAQRNRRHSGRFL